MKRFIYIIAAAALVLTACAKEQFEHPTEQGIVNASSCNPTVTVDQETNQVTFSLGQKGVVPVWVLQDSAGEWTGYNARDNFSRIFVASGDYAVRMYVLNSNGLSPDYIEKTFHIDNTLVDFSKYVKYISNNDTRTWRINNAVEAHQACGESVGNPTGWWAAKPDEKAAFGLYDNRLSFSADGKYTFEPGAAGTVYVNVGVTEGKYAESGHDADYQVAVGTTTAEYQFAVDGDALMLSLPDGTPFPYIPNNDYMSDSRFHLISLTNSEMVLVWYTATGNGGGPIAWQFILTSKEEAVAESPLAGTWVMDSETPGHLACGESLASPTNWWSAGPNEKSGFGLYDNRLTFTSDGTYTFDPGEDGNIYVNIGTTVFDNGGATADFDYPWETQTGKYTFDGEVLTLPEHFTLGYIPNDKCYENPTFVVTELTDSRLVMVSVTDEISWQFIFKKEGSGGGGEEPGTGYTYGPDLLDGLYLDSTWFSPSDWSGGLDPQATYEGGKLTLTVPDATGGSEWQGQVKLVAPIPADPEKQYAFFATIESSDGGTATVKVADAADDSNHAFFYDNAVVLGDSTPLAYVNEPVSPDREYESVMVIFDFGRMPVGSEITVTGIKLCEITGTSGGSSEGYTYGSNLWTGSESIETWFSPSDWSGGLDPQATYEGGTLKLTVPDGVGGSEWQGQVKLHSDIPIDPAKTYGFSARILSSESATATVKLTSNTDPGGVEFFYDPGVALEYDTPLAYKRDAVSMDNGDGETVMIVFDFGRFPAGTEITVSDIFFAEITGSSGGGTTPVEPEDPDTQEEIDESGVNLWPDAGATLETWFSPSDWSGGLEPQIIFPLDGNGIVIVVPEGVGGSEWQGQVKIHTDIPVQNPVNFAARIASTRTGLCTVKLTTNTDPDGASYLYDNNVALKANKTVVYQQKGLSMEAGEDETIMLIFDLGRMQAGTVVTITDIGIRVQSAETAARAVTN